ncbi:hypothetical protein [Epilithonimonas arachidiradicis]|uniref:Uncharacterized protein n=1 Tax=Epilithonimonas arachidiradicis TaxID=1617282 RepID=A0A420DAP4_9FLAO|nr:hypothetical protein [Epilithonimonas arachidiradicis]RKE88263.1 hypothetical protein BXY58_1408 [Epilithonimonas arachidiradicis]GGG50162.1 hypothetical protein GCM10007332_09700 [Epilithonimonas arachidiradicis]
MDYSFIVTNEKITIPDNVIFFQVRDLITFPLDIDGFEIEFFIEEFENNQDDNLILNLLRKINLIDKNFIVGHSSDFSGVTMEEYQAGFKNGKLIPETVYLNDSEQYKSKYDKAFSIMNYNPKFVRKFTNFITAQIEFDRDRKNLK